jgi:hypothetical protein
MGVVTKTLPPVLMFLYTACSIITDFPEPVLAVTRTLYSESIALIACFWNESRGNEYL